ncbi:MAG: hypothetical protein KA190_23350 [Kofleriaceae bacterium]|jgi:hypothetical protein|nr:hypothetical protein [Kofleriaceae bacterium]
MIELNVQPGDDAGFVAQIQAIVAGLVRVAAPRELYLVRVDNWFGASWLGFSHKVMGAFGVAHRRTLAVPPFVPARVVSQRFLRRQPDGAYSREATTLRLHIAQRSEDNRRRSMAEVCPDAAVCWWSGQTTQNARGALMAYVPTTEGHVGWYAEFRKLETWGVARTRGVTVHELATYAAEG